MSFELWLAQNGVVAKKIGMYLIMRILESYLIYQAKKSSSNLNQLFPKLIRPPTNAM